LPGLLDKPGRGAFFACPHRPLLDGQVPHIPGMSALRQQVGDLSLRWIQAISGHGSDSNIHHRHSFDHPEGRESRFHPVVKGGIPPRPIS
jgi:hypothetical protein